jgi:aryl-alcohol dehydrogenase-like predicted oxidoreductase
MEYRTLGATDLRVSAIAFGGSALGEEYGPIDLDEGMRAVRVALDLGLNFIDTSPYYGRGLSELLVGRALRGVPRERYLVCTKVGRYDTGHFDFSARRVEESVDVSRRRLGVDHIDVCLCHDVEFASIDQIVEETLPALRRLQRRGIVRFVGVSAYPLKVLRDLLARTRLDVVLSYSHHTLQNDLLATLVPSLRGAGLVNASPFSGGLLTGAAAPPPWHKASAAVREACRLATERCRARGAEIAQLALQWALRRGGAFATCVVGTPTPEHVRQWAAWAEQPLDEALLAEVLEILRPVRNVVYAEGRPENN